ncbi:MAG: hypothetical protein WCL11_26690, partial [Verrucomicrobiota bacterium]
LVKQLNPFFHCLAQVLVNRGFVAAMHRAGKKAGAAANEAQVFVAPLDKHYASFGIKTKNGLSDYSATDYAINQEPLPSANS